ncbi:MAG: putative enzyme related to lactoylglutathione lyase [Arenicella sp.]|jgi:predicted enzyme related to lactoylglutathione lyase
MSQFIAQFSLLVDDYDRAIDYYTSQFDFELIEDTQLSSQKRWVRLAPRGGAGGASRTCILLAKASTDEQRLAIGNQSGGRVFLFLSTDDFWSDFQRYQQKDIKFIRQPQEMPYGTVAVMQDRYGNLWDLVQYSQ